MSWILGLLSSAFARIGGKGFIVMVLVISHGAAGWIGYALRSDPAPQPAAPTSPDMQHRTVDAQLPGREIQWPEMPEQLIVYKTRPETVRVEVPVPTRLAATGLDTGETTGDSKRRMNILEHLWITSRSPLDISPETVTISAFDPAATRWKQAEYAVPPPTWKYYLFLGGTLDLGRTVDVWNPIARGLRMESGVGYRNLFLGVSAGYDPAHGPQFLLRARWMLLSRL